MEKRDDSSLVNHLILLKYWLFKNKPFSSGNLAVWKFSLLLIKFDRLFPGNVTIFPSSTKGRIQSRQIGSSLDVRELKITLFIQYVTINYTCSTIVCILPKSGFVCPRVVDLVVSGFGQDIPAHSSHPLMIKKKNSHIF